MRTPGAPRAVPHQGCSRRRLSLDQSRRFADEVRAKGSQASAESLLEPRVVAYGGEVVVSARVLAEPR